METKSRRGARKLAVAAGLSTKLLILAACAADPGNGGGDGGNTGETWILRVSHHLAETHPNSQAIIAMMDEIEDATDGRVKAEFYWSGTLCTSTEARQCVADGRADVALTAPVEDPSAQPIGMLQFIPFLTSDPNANAAVISELASEWPEYAAELEKANLHLLWIGESEAPAVGLTAPVSSLEDLSGKSIRTTGPVGNAFATIGVNPVNLPAADTYEALERGVLDGAVTSLSAFAAQGIHEIANQFYDLADTVGSYALSQISLNLDVYNSFPAEIQEAVDGVAESIAARYHEDFVVASYDEICDQLESAGSTFTVWEQTPFATDWVEDSRDVVKASWIEGVEGILDDPEARYEEYVSLLEEREDPDQQSPVEYCAAR